jgi:hypothetical protein
VRGNVSGFAHTGGEDGVSSVIGPNSTPGAFPDVPFVIGVYSAFGEAAQPGNLRPIDSEILFNYPGSTAITVNPFPLATLPGGGTGGTPTNTAAASIAAVRGGITIGGTYTEAAGIGGAGSGTAGVDPARTTATTISGGFLYGVQGKLIVAGTISSANYAAALQGQLDLSNAVGVTGNDAGLGLSCLWLDAGAAASSAVVSAPTKISLAIMTNTTSAVIHAVQTIIANAAYLFDITDLSGDTFVVTSSGVTTQAKSLKVHVDGVDYYIPLCTGTT